MIIGKQMPTCRDLQLHPHINKRKQNMDVRCQSVWAYSHIHSMILGNKCQLAGTYSCILTYNQTMQHDHRRANANLQGLTIASSQSNKQNKSYEWPMRSYTLSFHIIGANGQKRWTYNCPQWANNNDSITKSKWDDHALMAIDDDKCIAYRQTSAYEAINQSMNNKQHTL